MLGNGSTSTVELQHGIGLKLGGGCVGAVLPNLYRRIEAMSLGQLGTATMSLMVAVALITGSPTVTDAAVSTDICHLTLARNHAMILVLGSYVAVCGWWRSGLALSSPVLVIGCSSTLIVTVTIVVCG